jgi:hypothetical protein
MYTNESTHFVLSGLILEAEKSSTKGKEILLVKRIAPSKNLEVSLADKADFRIHLALKKGWRFLPEFTKYWFSVMKNDNLLYAYASESGIDDVLKRMDHRTDFVSGMGKAIHELRIYKENLKAEFEVFFYEMQQNLMEKF